MSQRLNKDQWSHQYFQPQRYLKIVVNTTLIKEFSFTLKNISKTDDLVLKLYHGQGILK